VKRPTIDEQLTAAAWRILTDGQRHAPDARTWARTYLGMAREQRQRALREAAVAQLLALDLNRPRIWGRNARARA
jgi:hypothetical protein